MDNGEMNTEKKRGFFDKSNSFNAVLPTPISFSSDNSLNYLVNKDLKETSERNKYVGNADLTAEIKALSAESEKLKDVECLMEVKKKELITLTTTVEDINSNKEKLDEEGPKQDKEDVNKVKSELEDESKQKLIEVDINATTSHIKSIDKDTTKQSKKGYDKEDDISPVVQNETNSTGISELLQKLDGDIVLGDNETKSFPEKKELQHLTSIGDKRTDQDGQKEHVDLESSNRDRSTLKTIKSKKRKKSSEYDSKIDHKSVLSHIKIGKHSLSKVRPTQDIHDTNVHPLKYTSISNLPMISLHDKLQPSNNVSIKAIPEKLQQEHKQSRHFHKNSYSVKHHRYDHNGFRNDLTKYTYDKEPFYNQYPINYDRIANKINKQRRLSSKIINNLRQPHSKSLPNVLRKYHTYFKKACGSYSLLSEVDSNIDSLLSDTNSSLSTHQSSFSPPPSSISSPIYSNSEHSTSYHRSINNSPAQSVSSVSYTNDTFSDNNVNDQHTHEDNKHYVSSKKNNTQARKENVDDVPNTLDNNNPKQMPKNNKMGSNSRISPKFWTTVENNRLLAAVQKYGNQWSRVSTVVKNRSSRQCKEHWTRVLSKREEAHGVNARVIAKHSKARETEKLLIQWKNYRKIFTDNKDKKLINIDKQLIEPNDGKNAKLLPNGNNPQSIINSITLHKKLSQLNDYDSSTPDLDAPQYLSDGSFTADSLYDLPRVGIDTYKALQSNLNRNDPLSKKELSIFCKRYENTNSSQNKIKVGYWLPDEDRALIAAHAILGPRWIQVANIIPGRTKRQCERRFRRLREKLKKRITDSDGIVSQI